MTRLACPPDKLCVMMVPGEHRRYSGIMLIYIANLPDSDQQIPSNVPHIWWVQVHTPPN